MQSINLSVNPMFLLVKALGFKHTNMMEWFVMNGERMVLYKSAQNPDIYHRDYIAAPNGNREVNHLTFGGFSYIVFSPFHLDCLCAYA